MREAVSRGRNGRETTTLPSEKGHKVNRKWKNKGKVGRNKERNNDELHTARVTVVVGGWGVCVCVCVCDVDERGN